MHNIILSNKVLSGYFLRTPVYVYYLNFFFNFHVLLLLSFSLEKIEKLSVLHKIWTSGPSSSADLQFATRYNNRISDEEYFISSRVY